VKILAFQPSFTNRAMAEGEQSVELSKCSQTASMMNHLHVIAAYLAQSKEKSLQGKRRLPMRGPTTFRDRDRRSSESETGAG
jgi:hypothetical protein